MLYRVMFQDGTTFEGENYYKTNWLEIPEKPIKQISFILPDGNFLTLRGYESYNHFIEATREVYGKNIIGKPTLRYQYIMGKRNNKVDSYRITLFNGKNQRFRLGDITYRQYEFGKEYSGKPTSGWRQGVTK